MARKDFDLSSVMEAVSAPAEGPRNIEIITAEILTLKQDAGSAILGIGQRLIEAKEMLPHGEWLPWLNDRVDFSERAAQNFMRLAREWSNPQALADLGATKALTLLALPAEEREQFLSEYHVVNGDEKSVTDMTSRELEQAIRERDAARQVAEEARAQARAVTEAKDKLSADNALLKNLQQSAQEAADQARKDLETVRAELKALQDKPVDVAVMEVDQAKLDAARAEAAAEMQAKLDKAKSAKVKAEEKCRAAEAALADANAKLEAAAKAEKREIIGADLDLTTFNLLLSQMQKMLNMMQGILLKARGREDQDVAGRLERALMALGERVKEAAR